MENGYLNCEMHCHTFYSACSSLSFNKIIKHCQMKKIDVIAITDHNEIKGAIELKNIAPSWLKVIIGEEIKTRDGEVIGLFLTKKIEPYLSLKETIKEIKEQNGVVYLPHPFDYNRKNTISKTELQKYIDLIDIIEVYNSRVYFRSSNKKALQFSLKYNILPCCGSDAHTAIEIGKSILKIHPFEDSKEFKQNLSKAILFSQKSPLFVHIYSKILKLFKKSN